MNDIDRRHFVRIAGRAVPIVVGVPYLVGCSSTTDPVDDSDDEGDVDALVIVSVSSVNAGHTHSTELPKDDVALTTSKGYASSSSSGHTHTVTFTSDDFETLRTEGAVTVVSSNSTGHSHSFTFRT